jgi:hypothetical protein
MKKAIISGEEKLLLAIMSKINENVGNENMALAAKHRRNQLEISACGAELQAAAAENLAGVMRRSWRSSALAKSVAASCSQRRNNAA